MAIIATWNLGNLFRPGGDFGPKTNAVYDAKLDGLARVIDAIVPDVLAVEEVGDRDALSDLVIASTSTGTSTPQASSRSATRSASASSRASRSPTPKTSAPSRPAWRR